MSKKLILQRHIRIIPYESAQILKYEVFFPMTSPKPYNVTFPNAMMKTKLKNHI